MHFELEFFIIICFNYKILQLSLRLGFLLGKKINTVERLYNEVLGIMIDFLYLSNSKIYEKKTQYNKTSLHNYGKHILPVSWPFVKSMFHCNE